ncbi:PHP domain-containing protein [Candidatus Sumerlaeota bacterium]|nr:PHP domain-containing protein [Candidatus Sumerlaeota bacterium]
MPRYHADLHSHSTASDGSDPPARVVERAKERGLHVLALTDHDTVAGVAEAREAGHRLGVQVIAGTELTCYIGKREIHVLGYGIDIDHPGLKDHCAAFQEKRIERAQTISRRLAEAGAPIDIEAVMRNADGGVIGRPHIARALIDAGHVKDFQEAFDRFLGDGKPANVPKLEVSPKECVAVIRDAGGMAIMAHPALGDQFDLIDAMIAAGCSGLEVCHSSHDEATQDRLHSIVIERGLAHSGGSDCHGTVKGCAPILGNFGLNTQQWKKFTAAFERATGRPLA